ncbi:MAG: hypothetical protein U5L74_07525 [Ideonella sp.]|nr:hypothetical protein [Ideonella sp.]
MGALLQDSLIKVMRHDQRLSELAQLRAWLFEVKRNTLIDRVRATLTMALLPTD